MPLGLVLVIEDDEWISRLLQGAIRDADYDVVVCGTAKAGLETACSLAPDCIVCDIDLPDSDGYWIARNVRTQTTPVAVTPFLFLSGLDDQEARLEGFHVGADVYMTKPFRVDEVVAQVGALVQMAIRLRSRRDSMRSLPAEEATAIEGDLSQMSIATVLTVLEMERRTGVVEVVSKRRRAQLEIASGFVVNGTIGGSDVGPLSALRTMLGWKIGRFSFVPQPHAEPPVSRKSIGAFLIEAVRLEDESARDAAESSQSSWKPPTSRNGERLSAPVLGGPPMAPDDFAPPSSLSPVPARRSSAPIFLDPDPMTPRPPSVRTTPVTPERSSPQPPPPSVPNPPSTARSRVAPAAVKELRAAPAMPPPPMTKNDSSSGAKPSPPRPIPRPAPRPAFPPRPDPLGKKR
jgi:two-component system OmpR family response regulator